MPRRNRAEDLDFEIHVDPSCLSDPMDDNEQKGHEEPKVEVEHHHDTENNDFDTNDKTDSPTEPKGDDRPAVSPAEIEDDKEPSGTEPELKLDDDDDTQQKPEEHTDKSEEEPDKPAEAEAEATVPEEASLDKDEEPAVPVEDHEEDKPIEDKAKAAESDAEEATPAETNEEETHHSETESEPSGSRRDSSASSGSYASDRRHSGRTEALIQKAARDIVAQMSNDNPRDSLNSYSGTEETGYISHSEPASARQSDAHMSVAARSHASVEDGVRSGVDEAGDNSSHHEHEDDVFSDRSPRSSMGSVSETDNRKAQEAMSRMGRSPRLSGVSGISGLSEYEREEEEFIPTIRGNPRPAFRSPSSVKAIQMSSPPASVLGTPRSSTRRAPLPTVSRLGSPRFSEQYSPKKTPPRFKRATPPLVLLHVTLLPLRWPWGDVLENAEPNDMSQECKTIRDAWRQLQDRMGDTTVERGILLPHPQSDYEILEERLLEALELPMRRRARILECGHYLGPSNEMTLEEESDSEEYDSDYDDETRRSSRRSQIQKMHWCKTCRSDIRYESLGPGKIFRVKVYASNGLIRGGAWEACWKEMERVDVEIEPLVDALAQQELVQLEADQERELAMREAEEEERYARLEEEEREFEERERGRKMREERSSRLVDEHDESEAHLDEESHLDEGITHLGEGPHLEEGETHLEAHDLRDESLHERSLHNVSVRGKSLQDESIHDKSIRDESVHDKSLHDRSLHDESLRDIPDTRQEESLHDITRYHESHIADITEPVDQHTADVTRASVDQTADITKDDIEDHVEADKRKSLEELERELDEHLKEERERSQAEAQSTLEPEADVSRVESVGARSRAAPSSRAPSIAPSAAPEDHLKDEAERQWRDDERLREIYGDVPPAQEDHQEHEQRSFSEHQPQHHDQHYTDRTHPSASSRASDYMHASPPSPSAEAFARREERRQAMKSASLPELVAESARVLMQDKKNVLIGLLSVLILMLAIRGGPAPPQDPRTFQTVVRNVEVPTVTVTQGVVAETVEAMRDAAASVGRVVEEESSVEAEMPEESVVAEMAVVPEESYVPIQESYVPVQESQDTLDEGFLIEGSPEVVERENVVDSNAAGAPGSSSPSPDSYTTTSASSTESHDPCASCTRSSRGADHAANQRAQAPAAADEHVQVLQLPQRETETETIVSERVVRVVETAERVVRVVETVTAVETATVKVTETATEVVVSRETQFVEARAEVEAEESVVPVIDGAPVDQAEAPVENAEAPVDEAEVPTEVPTEVPSEEAAPPAEEMVAPSEEVQDPAQETLAAVGEPLEDLDIEATVEAASESVAPEAAEPSAEQASQPEGEHEREL